MTHDNKIPERQTLNPEVSNYDYEVSVAPIDVTKMVIESTSALGDDDNENEDETGELENPSNKLLLQLIGETGNKFFPHMAKGKDHKFDPYLAVRTSSTFCDVDDEYLLRNIMRKDTGISMDYRDIKWKPREIDGIETIDQLMLDIETTGLDPDDNICHMVGVRLKGPYRHMPENYRKYEKLARNALIFTYNNPEWDREYKLKFGLHVRTVPETGEEYGIFVCKNEADMLRLSMKYIDELKPKLIHTHNGYNFDFPFVETRMKVNKLHCPFTVVKATDRDGNYRPLFNTAASFNGAPIQYDAVYWAKPDVKGRIWNDGTFSQLIDTLHLAAQQDKLMANMSGYGLKYLAAVYCKGRVSRRDELSFPEMQEGWKKGGEPWLRFVQYLCYDVQDQEIVSDYFLPNVYEQQRFMPLPLQEISVASPAKKWDAIMREYYQPLYGRTLLCRRNDELLRVLCQKPETDPKLKYEGAIAKADPAMCRGWYKVDVASLYPSIMLKWKLFDNKKDPLGLCLYILEKARELRYVYKKKGNKAVDAALKVLLNGAYGWMGTGGYGSNSIPSAAIVTAYGRVMMRLMCHAAAKYARIISTDTDGVYLEQLYSTGKADPKCVEFTKKCIANTQKKWDETDPENEKAFEAVKKELLYHRELLEEMLDEDREEPRIIHSPPFVHWEMQNILPEGIVLELEDNFPKGGMFSPKAKNYIKWETPDSDASVKGLYRKRNRTVLQKDFIIEYARRQCFEGTESAVSYKGDVLAAIDNLSDELSGVVRLAPTPTPIELGLKDVAIKSKIPKSDKKMQRFGMGQIGDICYYYHGEYREKYKRASKDGSYKHRKAVHIPISVKLLPDGTYIQDAQDFTTLDDVDPDSVFLNLSGEKYRDDFAKSVNMITEIHETCASRTDNMISHPIIALPQWWHDEYNK